MAAYAAVVSLMRVLDDIEHHPCPPVSIDRQQVESLTRILTVLQEFLEGYRSPYEDSDEADPLEIRIVDAIYGAEDVIESYIVDNIHLAQPPTDRNRDEFYYHEQVNDGDSLYCFMTDDSDGDIVHDGGGGGGDGCADVRHVDDDGGGGDSGVCDSDSDDDNGGGGVCNDNYDDGCDEHINCVRFYQDLQKVIEEMEQIKREVSEMVREDCTVEAQLQRNISAEASLRSGSGERKSKMVGFDDVLLQLMDRLTGGHCSRQIIPIVGMGGIGKTTLARNIYAQPLIKEHFDICVWATISQDYNIGETLREVVSQTTGASSGRSVNELGEELYKYLCGRRYLIVLDDMWSIEVWDKIRFFFPDYNDGSRILVTTRLANLGTDLTDSSSLLRMGFLDEASSLDLFSRTVFGEGSFPLELEEIGKKIVGKCKGLPLSIVVIGGLLAKCERMQANWEHVEENLNSIVNSENEEYCLRILKMSYNHLPAYLKPCFLYMGVFEEDRVISVSDLIELWVCEGFLKPTVGKSLKTVAKEYLKELIDRNLVLVLLGSSIKHIKVHDLLRDVAMKEAQKQGFYHVLRDEDGGRGMGSPRRIVLPDSNTEEGALVQLDVVEPLSRARSCVHCGGRIRRFSDFRLLRVLKTHQWSLDFPRTMYDYFLDEVFGLANSRYLALSTRGESVSPYSISSVWNLQTLIISASPKLLVAPVGIWKMRQLRHLEFPSLEVYLQDPPSYDDSGDAVVLENLETLKGVRNLYLSEEVVRRIPNIKKLLISYWEEEELITDRESRFNSLSYLNRLSKLESFYCSVHKGCDEYLERITFPRSLEKLTLYGFCDSGFEMECMLEKTGSLPLLQKLVLGYAFFRTRKWETVEGQFPSLKVLSLSQCHDLESWTVPESSHFPILRELLLWGFDKLKEVPPEIGDITTLKALVLDYCSESAAVSAKRIAEEQEDMHGDEMDLHVQVRCRD